MTVSDLSIIKSNKFFIGKVTEDQKDIWELKNLFMSEEGELYSIEVTVIPEEKEIIILDSVNRIVPLAFDEAKELSEILNIIF
ncbi:hypothetical protein UFOVP1123_122 [uncultured Caudovirales phage]|uniref:Uncharacterized protein n=1 Tax=uncultured Caudovirales phage TaxID=2100421 RepID=A0A6J5QYA8_9CAUD|nr:hypothetical protein UFOVP1123_122 [uncultured Caudovirales phage]